MKTRAIAYFLFISGLILMGIGVAILVAPAAFYASNGIELGQDASLLSEVRAPGGLLAASGVLIFAGVFLQKIRPPAVVLATLVYGSFGLSRLLGMALDGMPSGGIVGATVLELTVAVLGFVILARRSGSANAARLTEELSATDTAN